MGEREVDLGQIDPQEEAAEQRAAKLGAEERKPVGFEEGRGRDEGSGAERLVPRVSLGEGGWRTSGRKGWVRTR